ncbi:uncharacterized protein LOC108330355 [Vigna angularis]|uniref:uncharacterized protein LOC108330355 n=1 Tax=Phaseolus angularis TaxID=3914 RepID=UPI000809EA91|nr:uncharacterized protein LOC108330355 [Vigna angularis]
MVIVHVESSLELSSRGGGGTPGGDDQLSSPNSVLSSYLEESNQETDPRSPVHSEEEVSGPHSLVPSYVNFLKKFNKKRKSSEEEIIEVQSNCSMILQKAFPLKAKDPGSFNIPCTIGSHERGKALIDLGSSINLMPISVLKKIGGLEVKPTKRKLLKISWCGHRKENTKIKVGIG